MNTIEKFEKDKEFKTIVLKFEGMIDASIVNSASNSKSVTIKAPLNLTNEIFEVLWKRYTEVGWTNFSWNKETNLITIQKRNK